MDIKKDLFITVDRKKHKYFLYLYTFFLVIISTVNFPAPLDQTNEFFLFNIPNIDKFIHFILYFFCSFFYYRSFPNIIASVLYGSLLGIFLEIVQYFTPDRFFDFRDILANICGSTIFALIIYLKKSSVKLPSNK